MSPWDWLASPIGVDLVHAVIVLLLAAAGWLTYLTHRGIQNNGDQLVEHLRQHQVADLESKGTEHAQVD